LPAKWLLGGQNCDQHQLKRQKTIFRGLIYRRLRRYAGVPAAILASAAIFAAIHLPSALLPVFGLGVVTALVYERTKLLIGPMIARAVYNAGIVGIHFFL
jgi:ABC-2 type transport system permease protein